MNNHEQVWLFGFTKMADNNEDEMTANNSESEMKYRQISARTDIRPIATAGCKH
jgi:hypothetical protein